MQSDNAQSSASCSRCTYYRCGICFLRRIAVKAWRSDQRVCECFKSQMDGNTTNDANED